VYALTTEKKTVDSLLSLVDQAKPKQKIDFYLQIIDLYRKSDSERALKYANQALILAQSLDNNLQIALIYNRIGSIALQMNRLELAKTNFEKALQLAEGLQNFPEITENLHDIGVVFSNFGDLNKAKESFNRALLLGQKTGDTSRIIYTSVSLGNIYLKKGNYEEAIKLYNKAMVLQELTGYCIDEKARIYNNFGVLFSEQGKYKKSLDYYKRAAIIYDSLKNKSDLGKTYNNLGNIYWYQEEYDTAESYYKKSIQIRRGLKDKKGEAFVLNNLGMLAGNRGKLDLSIQYFEQSLLLFESIQNRNGILLSSYNLGEIYTELNQFKKAEKYYYQSLSIAKNDGAMDYELAILKSLTALYKKNKDYKNATAVFDQYLALNDSVEQHSKTKQTVEMEARFDREKKKTTLAFLQQKVLNEKTKANQLKWAIGLVALALMFGFLVFSVFYRKQKSKLTTQRYILSQQFLQYQMNPGFLYQSLNFIREFLYKNKTKEAGVYLSNFARLIRTFIENSTAEHIGLEAELETLQHYLKLRQAGYEEDFTYSIEVDEDIEPEFIELPPFLIFPFMDILLGRFGLSDTLNIRIKLKGENKQLHYETNIDFTGSHYLDSDDLKKALEDTNQKAKERIRLIYKLNKKKIDFTYDLAIKKENKKLQLHLKIPIN
jgi:tetratricopeptide (TPR) repeat protein